MHAIGFGQHNHAECISKGLDSVDAQCRAAGLKFTPVRRRVLEMLLAEHRAHGAYEILDNLRAEGLGLTATSILSSAGIFSQEWFCA